jgi:pyruvate carboxylase subunit B
MKGNYGRSPAPVNSEIYKKIIGDEEPIECRPADLLEPEFDKFKKEGEAEGLIKCEEDVITLALYPAVAKKFLKGEAQEEELLPAQQLVESNQLSAIPTEYAVEVDGDVFDVKIIPTGFMEIEETEKGPFTPVEGGITSSMQGMVLKIKVNVGDKVTKGSVVAVLEAMKMDTPVNATADGTVSKIYVTAGQSVQEGEPLIGM